MNEILGALREVSIMLLLLAMIFLTGYAINQLYYAITGKHITEDER